MMIKRILYLVILLSMFIKLDAQYSNPFEISARIDSTALGISSQEKLSGVNPFEVNFNSSVTAGTVTNRIKTKRNKSQLKATSVDIGNYHLPLIIGIVSLILIAIALNTSRSALSYLYTGLLNENQFRIFQREQKNGQSLFSYILYAIFILNLSIFLCLVSEYMFDQNIWRYFLLILAGVFGIYLMKHLILRMSQSVFPFSKELTNYDFMVAHSNMAVSLGLMITNILIAFTSASQMIIWVVLITLALFLLLRYWKGVTQSLKYRDVSLFHFFMYICAFEIIPNLCLCVYVYRQML